MSDSRFSYLRDFNICAVDKVAGLHPVNFRFARREANKPHLQDAARDAFSMQCEKMAYIGLDGRTGLLNEPRVEIIKVSGLLEALYQMQICGASKYGGKPKMLCSPAAYARYVSDMQMHHYCSYLSPVHYIENSLRMVAYVPRYTELDICDVIFTEEAGEPVAKGGVGHLRFAIETVRYFDLESL